MANPILVNGVASPQSVYETFASPKHALGTKAFLDDGTFYYARAGATALSRCLLNTRSARVANHVSVAWASGGAANSNKVTVTLGATAATANQYADGILFIHDGTGSGTKRKIKSHPAADASATLELTMYDNLDVASVTGDEVTLVANLYGATIVHPGNAAPIIVGVPQVAVPISDYYWAQTWGPGLVQGDGSTFVDGIDVVPASAGTADAGQVTIVVETGTTENTNPVVGRCIDIGDAASDLDYRLIDLRIRA